LKIKVLTIDEIAVRRFETVLVLVGLFFCLICILTNGRRASMQASASNRHLLISEVFYDTGSGSSSEEWIEIYNPTRDEIDLSGYLLGDEETKGGGEGMYRFPDGAKIRTNEKIIIALKASGFCSLYNKFPDYEFVETEDSVPNMKKEKSWATGVINLANSGDEVLLISGESSYVDVVVYENGQFLNTVSHPGVETAHSLERACRVLDTDNCANDFIDQINPNPETGTRLIENRNLNRRSKF